LKIELKAVTNEDIDFLYELLKEREGIINISHKKLPSFSEHEAFVKSSPYQFWEIIWNDNERIGNIYLTNRDELGIFIKKKSQSMGSGSIALQKFLKKTGKKRFLANVNPTNYKSIQFFGKNGFSHIQNTYHKKIDS
jgi:RimJ/RimL family protein N-acetyltransferase